jgi:hypothetical protein
MLTLHGLNAQLYYIKKIEVKEVKGTERLKDTFKNRHFTETHSRHR